MLLPTSPGAGAPPQGGADPVEILNAMLQLATLYKATPSADQQDKLAMERVTTLVQQLVAKDESGRQSAQSTMLGPQGAAVARLVGGQ